MSKYKYYAVLGEDGLPRACHFVPGHEPEGALEITAEQAAAISADLRARQAVEAPATPPPQNYVTREEAQRMAEDAAAKAVAAFAAEIVKPAGG